jgi:hypothetical protein
MGRKQTLQPHLLFNQLAVLADVATPASDVRQLDQIRYTLAWANGAAADINVYLEYTNTETNVGDIAETDWNDLDFGGAPSPNITGASGVHTIDVELLIGLKHRLRFDVIAGQADLSVIITGSTKGA